MDFLGKCVVWIIGALLSGAIYAGRALSFTFMVYVRLK